MKKTLLILILCFLTSIIIFAQLVEVRGVKIKQIERKEKNHSDNIETYCDFEFHNTNNFRISVEVERWRCNDKKEYRIDANDFEIEAGEVYTWKAKKFYHITTPLQRTVDSKLGCDSDWNPESYVKYKAYKIESSSKK